MPQYIQHDGRQFQVRAHRDCYETCFEVFRSQPRGKLLDIAAGAGYTSHVLKKMGFAVTATEINTGQFLAEGVDVESVDLNQSLPYPEASFPCVVALEIIEHLEAPSRFVREIARVLEPGGTALISTPNITTLSSKARFLFKNEFNLFYNVPDRLHDPFDDRAGGHISPMPLWLLQHFVAEAGLSTRANALHARADGHARQLDFHQLDGGSQKAPG
ncbi:MAG: class I SAM-dependent methyltransferase [Polyangiaceae bacterium]